MLHIPFIALCLFPLLLRAEEFTGEVYLLGTSVANNGSANSLPSQRFSPSQFLDFPAETSKEQIRAIEIGALPLFGSLSEYINGALAFSLDEDSQINAYLGSINTSGIQERPMLQGTKEERLNNPLLRPTECLECTSLRDVVYLGGINFMHKYSGQLPRTGISSRPIPVELSGGTTVKYFFEKLYGDDYSAQNLNLDMGLAMKILWGFNPVLKSSDRNFTIHFGAFEILQTEQVATFSGSETREPIEMRWKLGLVWEESLPALESRLGIGIGQASSLEARPAIALEWGYKDILFLRMGSIENRFTAGASLAGRYFAVHYAYIHHPLNHIAYQISMQFQLLGTLNRPPK